jgi:CubicO group peptidase (beta-lactamase class C family)
VRCFCSLARGYGLADVEAGRPAEPTTRFLLASVSKSITAVTALKLVQEGRLRLEDRAFDIITGIPPRRGASRIRVPPTSPSATCCTTREAGIAGSAAIR